MLFHRRNNQGVVVPTQYLRRGLCLGAAAVFLVEGHADPPLLAPNNETMLTLATGHEV